MSRTAPRCSTPLALASLLAALAACGPSEQGASSGGGGASASSTHAASGGSGGTAAVATSSGTSGTPVGVHHFDPGFVDLTEGLPAPFDLPKSDPGAMSKWVIDTGGIFADVDGDGVSEVILTHVTPPPGQLPGDTTPKLYRYENGSLVLVGPYGGSVFTGGYSFIPRALVDLDDDGVNDILTNTQIAWGKAGGDHEFPTFITGANESRGPVEAFDLADIDADGWLDILIGGAHCDAASPPLYALLRTGLRTYDQDDTLIQQPTAGRSYAAMAMQVGGERVVGTLFSSCFTPGGDPPAYYRWTGQQYTQFDLLPSSYELVSPMGAAMGDIDGDGEMDLTISEKHDYFKGGSLPLEEITETMGFHDIPSDTLIPMIPWGVAFLDLDRDGMLDVVTVHGNDFKAWFDPGWQIGAQWTTVHWNRGGLKFEEADAALGRKGQWKVLSVGDLEGDGDPDLIIGGGGERPRVYRNDIEGGGALALRLHGTTSNHLGAGATVDVWPTDGGPRQRYLAGSFWSPDLVSEPLVFAGLGDATSAAKVQITWPSGTVQEIHGLAAGKLHDVTEPAAFTIEPAGRHAAANGASIITIHVTPRNPDGTAKTATVTVQVSGSGTAGPVAKEGEGYRADLTAPAQPGSGVVTVTIDGVASPIRPRIWWD